MASTLEPLSLDELKDMLEFRWTVASGAKTHPFTDDAIRAIFAHSKGMPREANILSDNSLLLAFMSGQHEISGEIVNQVAADRAANLARKEAA